MFGTLKSENTVLTHTRDCALLLELVVLPTMTVGTKMYEVYTEYMYILMHSYSTHIIGLVDMRMIGWLVLMNHHYKPFLTITQSIIDHYRHRCYQSPLVGWCLLVLAR